jgi:uncharacterized protein
MKRYIQTKSIPVDVKDIDTSGRIVKGYFASFETLDSDGDIFQTKAFHKSINENGPGSKSERIKHLFNHWDAVGVLQELKEDGRGLFFVSKMGRHTLGEDVLKMYEDGIITEHSVGFKVVSNEKRDNANVITEAQLWEGSSLDKWGANMNTPVVKSFETTEAMIKRLGVLTKALREGSYSDETFVQLEIQLKFIQQYLEDTTEAGQTAPPSPESKNGETIMKAITKLNL